MFRAIVPEAILLLIFTVLLQGQQLPAPDSRPPFHITVIEGEGSINNIHQTINRGATILVEDENRTPLSGVAVSFFLPNDGPSGLFPNGSHVLTVFTDDKGYASSRPVRFNNLVGLMHIRVVASLFSQTASATITQSNVTSGATMKTGFVPATGMGKVSKPSSSHKGLIILLAVGAAAGVAAAVLLTRTSSPSATIGTGSTTIGTPTIGGPK